MKNNIVVVFDLDDTLYKEIEYLKSAYTEISSLLVKKTKLDVREHEIYEKMLFYFYENKNVFSEILKEFKIKYYSVKELIFLYRNHNPKINLSKQVIKVLDFLKKEKIKIGIITDGRSTQQRSKIKSLGLSHYVDVIIISEEVGQEKPSVKNFLPFEEKYNSNKFMYVGDNLRKDFFAPNKLGWETVLLKDINGLNIHNQNIVVDKAFLPRKEIHKFDELINIISDYI